MTRFAPNDLLRQARLKQHLSRFQLAVQLDIRDPTIGRWERGESYPDSSSITRLCALFHLSSAQLGFTEIHQKPESSSITFHSKQYIYDPIVPLKPAIGPIGRDRILAHIKDRLCNHTSLLALNGLPGVGKTTLAITLAHDSTLHSHFDAGLLWAGLGPTPNLPGIFGRWGSLLGIASAEQSTLRTLEDWSQILRRSIGTRSILIIIDDVWQLEAVLACKVGGPNCTHLVTTRFPTIATHLTADNAIQLPELSEEDSLTFLNLLTPGILKSEASKSCTLVQAVGGLPLALSLIGNYLRTQAHGGQIRRIRAALERLSAAAVRLHLSEPLATVEGHSSLSSSTTLSLQYIISVTDLRYTQRLIRSLCLPSQTLHLL